MKNISYRRFFQIIGSAIILLHTTILPNPVGAQTIISAPGEQLDKNLQIISDEEVALGNKTIFRASASVATTSSLNYTWQFSDGQNQIEHGVEAAHSFDTTGIHTVTVRITAPNISEQISKDIFVYNKKIFLITGSNQTGNAGATLDQLKTAATDEQNSLEILEVDTDSSIFVTEDRLLTLFERSGQSLAAADMIIFDVPAARGSQAFARYIHSVSEELQEKFTHPLYINITPRDFNDLRFLLQQVSRVIRPDMLLLMHPPALEYLVTATNYGQLTTALRATDVPYLQITASDSGPLWHGLWKLLSVFVSQGISVSVIYLILIIPLIVLVTVFARQVLGMPTFGVYGPVMTAASFLMLGLKLGLLVFCFVIVVTYCVKFIINRAKLLYISKVGLNLSLLSASFLFLIWVIGVTRSSISLSLAIFPMLLMATVAEKFIAAQSEEGFRQAILAVISTTTIIVVSFLAVTHIAVVTFVQSWPEIILLAILFTFILGKFTGLRLDEYIRFRTLLRDNGTEE